MAKPFAAPHPWNALDELPLVIQKGPNRGIYTLRVGQYGNGRPAFQVLGPRQEPWETLTTNLPDELLGDDEVHVKENGHDVGLRKLLLDTGFFEKEDAAIAAGHVAAYAEVWRLRQGADGKYLVEDPYRVHNLRLAARAFEDAERAEEAARRLLGKPTRKREMR